MPEVRESRHQGQGLTLGGAQWVSSLVKAGVRSAKQRPAPQTKRVWSSLTDRWRAACGHGQSLFTSVFITHTRHSTSRCSVNVKASLTRRKTGWQWEGGGGLGRGPGAGWQPTLDSRRRSPRHSGRGAWGKPPASGTALHPQRCCHTWNHSSWWSGRGCQYKTPGLFSVERKDNKWDVRATEFALNTHVRAHARMHARTHTHTHTISFWASPLSTQLSQCEELRAARINFSLFWTPSVFKVSEHYH